MPWSGRDDDPGVEGVMFLGSYRFEGDPTQLVPAYGRLMAEFPPEALLLHVCVVDDGGITVLDACPSQAVFTDFSAGAEFRDAIANAGLPEPVVTPLGDVHRAELRAGE